MNVRDSRHQALQAHPTQQFKSIVPRPTFNPADCVACDKLDDKSAATKHQHCDIIGWRNDVPASLTRVGDSARIMPQTNRRTRRNSFPIKFAFLLSNIHHIWPRRRPLATMCNGLMKTSWNCSHGSIIQFSTMISTFSKPLYTT
jgi:hypothetical protein